MSYGEARYTRLTRLSLQFSTKNWKAHDSFSGTLKQLKKK
jgi:hypothetical protein